MPKRFRLLTLLEVLLDACLLTLFVAQAFIAGCLIIYGYLPLPTELGNRLINKNTPEALSIHGERFRFHTNGSISVLGLSVRTPQIEQSLFEATSAELSLKWDSPVNPPKPDTLVISGGTLFIPSIYSADGAHSPILENIALRIRPSDTGIQVDRFAALHDEIRLRGTFEIPIKQSTSEASLADTITQFYSKATKLSEQKERIRYFSAPTIIFKADLIDEGTQRLFIRAISSQLDHPEVTGEDLQLRSHLNWNGQELTTIQPPLLTASSLNIPRYDISGNDIQAEIPAESIEALPQRVWPQLRLAASSLSVAQFTLDAPILTINPSSFPEIRFHGATRSLNGAIDLRGNLSAENWSGEVRARGSVDLAKLANERVSERLPGIQFGEPPYFDLNLYFGENFALQNAQLNADLNDLTVADLRFDHIRGDGSFQDGVYSIDELFLSRQDQWLDLKFSLDTNSYDYRVTLIGSAVPYDYNSILPRWWEAIFRDFDFSNVSYSLGDFIIYGNTQRRASDLYFGRVEARDVSYKGVYLDEGELIVRGRETYTELHQLNTRSGSGWAKGNISFASKLDEVRAPASVRLDMEAALTLDDARMLFGERIAKILDDFETDALPYTQLDGAIFNSAYPQYDGKSYFDLSATCSEPITYKSIPLDYLNFDLYGRSDVTYLRNMHFGYADGQGVARIDVLTPKNDTTSVVYQLDLTDADQNEAIRDLPQLDEVEDSLESETAETSEANQREEARVDIQIEGQGPVNDIFAHSGSGQFEIRSEKLGTIQLLGPLSRILQNTQFNFTSFNLQKMQGDFEFENELVEFESLQIDGPLTQIRSPGTINLKDQSLNMRVSVNLLKNAGDPNSDIRRLGDLITKPIPNLLEFELRGTIQEQQLRSLYDPRNLIPRF